MPRSTENTAGFRDSIRVLVVLVAAIACVTVTMGCQEEVIGVRNGYNNPSWQLEQQASTNRTQQNSGPLEAIGDGIGGVGEALFGWMDDKEEPPSETQFSNRYAPTVRATDSN